MATQQTIARLCIYRRVLRELDAVGEKTISSKQLAAKVNGAATRVRRDVMDLGCSGVPNSGYAISDLLRSIDAVLDAPEMQNAALVGVGNLGSALLSYFSGRWRRLGIKVAFDVDREKIGRQRQGCTIHPVTHLESVCREHCISLGILAVPPQSAQEIAEMLVKAGVTGLLNFAPVRLHTSEKIYVEDMDLSMSLEKVAYYARHNRACRGSLC